MRINKTNPIPTFVINLKSRTDRRKHIEAEFSGKTEFNVTIVEAVEHERGATGLWQTIKNIIKYAFDGELEYVLFCEDDHCFTHDYCKQLLFDNIEIAQQNEVEILLGGVSGFGNAIPITESLFQVGRFSGLQFTIVFRRFFDKILGDNFKATDVADYKIAEMSNKKYVIYPFISIQKEFGYSDVTQSNNIKGFVDQLFCKSSGNLSNIASVHKYYRELRGKIDLETIGSDLQEGIVIPCFIMGKENESVKLNATKALLSSTVLFQTASIFAYQNDASSADIWNSIRKIVKKGIENEEDILIICKSDIGKLKEKSQEYIVSNIIKAHYLGAELLVCKLTDFSHMVPVSKNLMWISKFKEADFLVLYRNVFDKILHKDFEDELSLDDNLSFVTANKFFLYPFIAEEFKRSNDHLERRIENNVEVYYSHNS